MLENQVTNDVQKQFLRRTPIKLKQFARFLGDIANNEVDTLRIKALLSQVTKTRADCIEQEFEPTAKILNQLIKQLSMSRESLESQKPLLIRLAKRLADHAAKLSIGIKPQRKPLKSAPRVKPKTVERTVEAALEKNAETKEELPSSNLAIESIVLKTPIDEEFSMTDNFSNIDETDEESIEFESIDNAFAEEALLDLANINEELKAESENRVDSGKITADPNESSSNEAELNQTESNQTESNQADLADDNEFDYLKLYNDKSVLIFLSSHECQSASELDHHQGLMSQLNSLGIECIIENTLLNCIEQSNRIENSMIIAPLDSAESLKVLDDETIEIKNAPLIFTANEDNQENRLKAIRNGGTGFIIEPLSISSLFDQVELSFDANIETPCRILVMEDSKAQARYYEKVLQKGHFEMRVVNDPKILLEAIRGFDPETILMDMQMPDSSGIELTQMIRQMPRYTHLPIIFLSAEENLRKQNQALMSGGTAFIVKPVQKEQLMFMARLYTQNYRALNPQIDINPDTNVPYPAKFKQIIATETARATRLNVRLALVIVQLDEIEDLIQNAHFSFINNAISQLTQLLKKRLRQTDVIGHVDGNRLGIILTSGDKKHWADVMQTIQDQFANMSFNLEHQPRSLSVSMGISEIERNFSYHQWLERSNQALEEAIQNGSSQINWNR